MPTIREGWRRDLKSRMRRSEHRWSSEMAPQVGPRCVWQACPCSYPASYCVEFRVSRGDEDSVHEMNLVDRILGFTIHTTCVAAVVGGPVAACTHDSAPWEGCEGQTATATPFLSLGAGSTAAISVKRRVRFFPSRFPWHGVRIGARRMTPSVGQNDNPTKGPPATMLLAHWQPMPFVILRPVQTVDFE